MYAQKLMKIMTASQVSFKWWGSDRAVDRLHTAAMAQAVGASKNRITARKKIIDKSHPAYQALTKIRHDIQTHWQSVTLPYQDGVRLMPTEKLEAFVDYMKQKRDELQVAANNLQHSREEIVAQAMADLSDTYNSGDYPDDLSEYFSVTWAFPSTEPPAWLPPEVMEAEKQRIVAEFEKAVHLAEQAFAEELAEMVQHLAHCMESKEDGKPKVFRDSAVNNLKQFFAKFKDLSIGSSQSLEQVVKEAEALVAGITPEKLRKNFVLREDIKESMTGIATKLETLLVNKPKRKLLFEEEVAA